MGRKLFFVSVLSESRRVQIWEETKGDLATGGVVLQHLSAGQNVVPSSSRDAAEGGDA